VTALTRNPARAGLDSRVNVLGWNPPEIGSWAEAFSGADGVVNLAGEPIAEKRWTAAQKERILRSRVDATNAVVAAIRQAEPRPSVLVNGSAVGHYGPTANERIDETAVPGADFLAFVTQEWESAARQVEALGVRLVIVRTGIVLGPGGGALPRLTLPFRLYGGGPLSAPNRWLSWIQLEDEVGIILYALDHDVRGAVNATAPNPVTVGEFSRRIGSTLRSPSWNPLLRTAINLILGERSSSLFAGQRALPDAIQRAGYEFRYPELDEALRVSLGR